MDKIFVQIAAYCDPQLKPTVEDLFAKAKHPERLRVAILWQQTEEELGVQFDIPGFTDRIKIKPFYWRESKGVCWARHLLNTMWAGEVFTLQIDSHMRFVQDWDEEMVTMWRSLYDPSALLTGYPPEFEPTKPFEQWVHHPYMCHVPCFHGRYPYSLPKMIPNWQLLSTPIRGVHVSAGFIFGPGEIAMKVQYDPDLYFCGEETAMTVRFWTHGYNIYHPHRVLLWHYYTRPNEKKHWSDHANWANLNVRSYERLDSLLLRGSASNPGVNLGYYGLGTCRNLQSYITYSGIDTHKCRVHPETARGLTPPATNTPESWSEAQVEFNKLLTWDYNAIPGCGSPDVKFWALIVKDTHDVELFRKDLLQTQHADILSGVQSSFQVKFSHSANQKIKDIVIWPYMHSTQWTLAPYRARIT